MTARRLPKTIPQKIAWIVITLLAYLGYYAEVRPYFGNHHGIWSMGFLDGMIITSTLFFIGFYIWSISTNPEE